MRGEIMSQVSNILAQELVELFDMKKAKLRDEKRLNQEATEAQKDIRLLTLMFRDGIPDLSIDISADESIKWDARTQMLLYVNNKTTSVIEGTSREVRIKIRPYLAEMVKKAKDLYL
jgi:hypothetical protein